MMKNKSITLSNMNKNILSEIKSCLGMVAVITGNHPKAGTVAKFVEIKYVASMGAFALHFVPTTKGERAFNIYHAKHIQWLYKKSE